MKLFTIKNKIDNQCDVIYLAKTEERITRDFANNIRQQIKKYAEKGIKINPEDYEIRYLGEMDDTEGKITPYEEGYKIIEYKEQLNG